MSTSKHDNHIHLFCCQFGSWKCQTTFASAQKIFLSSFGLSWEHIMLVEIISCQEIISCFILPFKSLRMLDDSSRSCLCYGCRFSMNLCWCLLHLSVILREWFFFWQRNFCMNLFASNIFDSHSFIKYPHLCSTLSSCSSDPITCSPLLSFWSQEKCI